MHQPREKVYFIRVKQNEPIESITPKVQDIIAAENLLGFVNPGDLVAVKTHFGEEGTRGFVSAPFFAMLNRELAGRGSRAFLTETATLYSGRRSLAHEHIKLAAEHGFTVEETGMPIIMADGLLGDEEVSVDIGGKHYQKVSIASLFRKVQAAVIVSHFTGHVQTGFGAALKNMGMGCASRKGKMDQHSSMNPRIDREKCTGCGDCITECPVKAIALQEEKAAIDSEICYGCGQCLVVCRFNAVAYNWGKGGRQVQESCVEYALGLFRLLKGRMLFINFLNRITKDCDCMRGKYERILDDIGVLISRDPAAVDAASFDLVEKHSQGEFRKKSYDIESRHQIDHCRRLNFGNSDYHLLVRK